MANSYFRFKQFEIRQDEASFKVGTDGVLLGAWAPVINVERALDIGTGTGLIALMLAQRSTALITAIEPDEKSFLQACLNVENSPWKERVTIVNTDLESFINTGPVLFDLIVSNPPFFNRSLVNTDRREAEARHTISLTHGSVIRSSASMLNSEGRLCMVLPRAEGEAAVAVAADNGLWCYEMIMVKPSPESAVKRLLLGFGRMETKTKTATIVIESGGRHVYSKEYMNLTSDFYLDR